MAAAKTGKNSGAMALIVVVLLLTLVGAGTGFAVGSLLSGEPAGKPPAATAQATDPTTAKADDGHAAPGAEESADAAEGEPQEIETHAVRTVPFPPVLTTLAEPKGKWIRLEGSIQVVLETEDSVELLSERSGEQILTYLRSLRLDQLEGPSGVLGLREDLNEMVQTLSNGQVRGVLVHGLVVE
jgi:flagellar FliL protein